MSDLISRSELIEEINELLKSPYANQQQFGAERRETIEIVRDLCVKNQPTAYDIDGVVEELEENYFQDGIKNPMCIELDKAIEIVKQGGVDDDVCEWKQTSTARCKTSCGYKVEEYFDTNACYCKQCGKKIKIVGD